MPDGGGTGESLAPPGWYPVPGHVEWLQWWDGAAWTDDLAPDPSRLLGSDLATNRAGQAATAKAAEIRAAEPPRGFFRRLFGPPSEARSWERGASGERAVGGRLDRLPDGWNVLHAVPVGVNGSDIDHVVIGPGGVFCVNTKNHANARVWVHTKAFKVNGQSVPYLRNSRHEAERASRLLSKACGHPIPVEPIIVVLAQQYTEKGRPDDVHLLQLHQVPKWFVRRQPRLDPAHVAFIFERARQAETWKSSR